MALLRFRLPAWRGLAVTAMSVLLAAAQLATSPLASADPPAERKTDCDRSGPKLRYLIVFDVDTSAKAAKREITAACGTPTMYYDDISVGIATSADEDFAERIGLDRAFSAQAGRKAGGQSDSPAEETAERPRVRSTDPGTVTRKDRSGDQWDMRMINAEAARTVAPKASDVVVGVLDSGIDPVHPELSDAVDPKMSASCLTGKPNTGRRAWAPTTSVHGTHVAGTIAAADDGAGVTGVAPGVRLASIKVIGDRGQVDPEAAVCGLMWAGKHRMPVTNSSFFIDSGSPSCDPADDFGVVREAIRRAADYAGDAGTLNVAAATNESVSLSPASRARRTACEALPASLRSVVAVSAVDADGVKAGYSSYGLGVITLAAPGGDDGECVLSAVPGGYNETCGTSMAAPHVAGVAALLAARNPDAGPDQLRRTLTSTARQTACPADYDRSGDGHQDAYCTGYRGYNGFYGHGILDALAAVESMAGPERAEAPKHKQRKKSEPPRRKDVDRTKAKPPKVTDRPKDDDKIRPLQLQLGGLFLRR